MVIKKNCQRFQGRFNLTQKACSTLQLVRLNWEISLSPIGKRNYNEKYILKVQIFHI